MDDGLLLSAQGIAKFFGGIPALRNGCLELRAGSVHALCGGNGAGKSTFLNVLMGVLQRDAGTISVYGQEVSFRSPSDALKARMSFIAQELSPIPGMTVAENIFLGREPRRFGVVIDYARLFRDSEALLQRLEFDIDARSPMRRLSLAQTQLIEIAKAFSRDSRIIIMDEPTSAIGERETEILFRAIRRAAAEGAGIVYVSHRLSEIFSLTDAYTVFRDGAFIETGRTQDIDRRHLVRQIVGHELNTTLRERRTPRRGSLLEVSKLSRAGEFEDISLTVAPGEVLGIYGLMGSGRSEFLNCIFGLTRPDAGQIVLRGAAVKHGEPRKAIRQGLSLVTEDRKQTGLVLTSSVADNIALAALPRLSRGAIRSRRAEGELVRKMVQRLRVKLASPSMPVSELSGGNQQKVVMARCMSTEPVCLLCDEPTRGVDEGAKREIYEFLADFAARGGAVLLVSSEAPEILHLSDRIAIFQKGRLTSVLDGHSAGQDELLHLSS